jgi:amidase
VAAVASSGLAVTSASAYNVVDTTSGANWAINDAAIPGLDTGSVRNVTTSNALMGYGGIRMNVANSTSPLNGITLRGFGLTFDGDTSFESTNSVDIDGISVTREVVIDDVNSSGRFFDTFTNTTKSTQAVEVAFGGELGYNTGTNQTAIAGTSSGDRSITSADGWAVWNSPNATGASANGPSATTIGTPGFPNALNRMGDYQEGPFDTPLAASGDDANHPAFVTRVVIPAGQTRSVAHFVVTGLNEIAGGRAAGSQVAEVSAKAAALTTTPDFSGLSTADICTLANYNLATLTVPGFSNADCATLIKEPIATDVRGSVKAPVVATTSSYDVVGKTITQLTADMNSGKTNASSIVRAYLDRIAAYDQGPLGLHSVLTVAPDAMQQAKAADAARKSGDSRPLLGIPILVKDIIDTKDMPTTGGSLIFDGYRPTKDAWQVAKLREAGAIILGKANLSEFANSGHYSESAYGQVWNAFDPSKSSIGSSGGSAVAVASSFAAAAMGTQTGDSLWGPSGAASLVSLRGTDGMQSGEGVMPLTVVQDYVGFISQSVEDEALLLNATAKDNPTDPLDDISNGYRPADWTTSLSANSLRGKVIGVPATAFNDPFQTTMTSDALRAQFAVFEAAGATLKPIANAPAAPTRTYSGDTNYEGWRQWLATHPDAPYSSAEQIIRNPLALPYRRNLTPYAGAGPMSATDLQNFEDWRGTYRDVLASWMDTEAVDAVLYPLQLSDVHINDSSVNSFGRLDPQSSASGVPTAIFPAGANANGSPIGFQLQGKEFQDPELLGMAYAFSAAYPSVNNGASSRVLPTVTPALTYDAGAIPTTIEAMTPLPSPPSTTTPATGTTEADVTRTLVLDGARVKANKKGKFVLEVGCASSEGACTGTVTVRTNSGKMLGSKQVTVRAGHTKSLKFASKGKWERSLAKGKNITVKVSTTGRGATVSTGAAKVTVRSSR